MKKIDSLEELQKTAGKETVDWCFTEYMLLLIAKAKKFDELLTELESREDTEMISCAELKKRME